jgi:phosphatidylserine/phosphatidylglycerophosphate/cardiolipin synthase-like enzyme
MFQFTRKHTAALIGAWIFIVQPFDAYADGEQIRDAIDDALKDSDPKKKYFGVTWGPWRNDSSIESGWLLQTPGKNVWGVTPAPVWMSPGVPLTCSGSECNKSVMLTSCASNPDVCRATNTECTASAATVTRPGQAPELVCMSPADKMMDEVYSLVASAESTVDITSLLPMDGRFLLAFKNAITYLASKGRPITVRFLYGKAPTQAGPLRNEELLKELVADAAKVSGSKLTVNVGYIRSGTLAVSGWNHAKTIVADGKTLLIGGQNWFTKDYLGKDPVFDISVKLRGAAAADAIGFVNMLWTNLCDGATAPGLRRHADQYRATKPGEIKITRDCIKKLNVSEVDGGGSIKLRTVGRLGEIDYEHGDQSLAAIEAMIEAARDKIRISQQDLKGPVGHGWPSSTLKRLADQIVAKRDVYIVKSSDGAGGSISAYSNGSLKELAKKLKNQVEKADGAPKHESEINDLLCKHLYLAMIRFNEMKSYPHDVAIPSHAKVVAVDDSTVYIGSQNLYPPFRNMELGVIISDGGFFNDWKNEYWDRLWDYSKQGRISGGDPADCFYKRKDK